MYPGVVCGGFTNMIYDKQDQQGKAAHDPAKRASGKEPRRTLNKNRKEHKAENGHVNH
jgi:hypothetical protein